MIVPVWQKTTITSVSVTYHFSFNGSYFAWGHYDIFSFPRGENEIQFAICWYLHLHLVQLFCMGPLTSSLFPEVRMKFNLQFAGIYIYIWFNYFGACDFTYFFNSNTNFMNDFFRIFFVDSHFILLDLDLSVK